METTPARPPARPPGPVVGVAPGRRGDALVSAAAYLMLFLLGAAESVVGCFFYSSGPTPIAALLFALAMLGTCLLGGWGMRRPAGALAAALGWFAASFILATGTSGGSVVITSTAAGEWFLFGGAGCVVAGTIAAFVLWSRAAAPRR